MCWVTTTIDTKMSRRANCPMYSEFEARIEVRKPGSACLLGHETQEKSTGRKMTTPSENKDDIAYLFPDLPDLVHFFTSLFWLGRVYHGRRTKREKTNRCAKEARRTTEPIATRAIFAKQIESVKSALLTRFRSQRSVISRRSVQRF